MKIVDLTPSEYPMYRTKHVSNETGESIILGKKKVIHTLSYYTPKKAFLVDGYYFPIYKDDNGYLSVFCPRTGYRVNSVGNKISKITDEKDLSHNFKETIAKRHGNKHAFISSWNVISNNLLEAIIVEEQSSFNPIVIVSLKKLFKL